ncbi:TetR/AcrR family transcriptional regulator [Paenibacillus flagellatus]|uniref:TetR/AcrR family transcriptional regulator n=1 Tax=Paenibacillus flagellatus TaxID=2211139 RepID=UPI001FEBB0B8|nr:TetR family transcriptional regulator [Paenibacillus flagellatus]
MSETRKDAVRNDILEAAGRVFKRKGYEAASMKDIVAESGRSFGGVYLYYANKEQLFLELIGRVYREMNESAEGGEGTAPWEAVGRFLRDQLARAADADNGLAPVLYEYLIVGRKEERRMKLIGERHDAVFGAIERLLRSGAEAGTFRPTIPVEAIALTVMSFLDGMFFESIVSGPERIRLDDQFRVLSDMLRSVLMPGEASAVTEEGNPE